MAKNLFSKDLKVGDNVSDEIFALKKVKKTVTKDGKPYADIELADKEGSIKGKIWSEALSGCDDFKEGDVVRVFGKVGTFNNLPQLVVSSATVTTEYDLADFIAASEHNIDEMKAQLKSYFAQITNPNLKKLLDNIFDEEFFDKFCEAPAAYTVHHAYKGGMADHTLDILEMAKPITERYPNLNKDILFTGIILHDIGKLKEYDTGTTIQMTTEGKLLGHVYLGAQFVQNLAPQDMPKELLNELIHIILSHQGKLEFGSPILPKTPEAVALAFLDDTSAKLNTIYHTVKDSGTEGDFTEYQRHMGTDLYKSPYREENS